MIRALCMWNLKISAALYVRHFPSYDRRIWGAESKMSLTTLTTMTTIAWICVLSKNRARGEERWRRRCRWCKGWRSCAVARSSLPLSLLSPSLLLPQWNMQYFHCFMMQINTGSWNEKQRLTCQCKFRSYIPVSAASEGVGNFRTLLWNDWRSGRMRLWYSRT